MGKRKSSILETVHDTAKGLFDTGVMDQVTLREFDGLCLQPVEPMDAQDIRQLRERASAGPSSQRCSVPASPPCKSGRSSRNGGRGQH